MKESWKALWKESARERETVIVEAHRVDVSSVYSVISRNNLYVMNSAKFRIYIVVPRSDAFARRVRRIGWIRCLIDAKRTTFGRNLSIRTGRWVRLFVWDWFFAIGSENRSGVCGTHVFYIHDHDFRLQLLYPQFGVLSIIYATRLETRIKEFKVYASHWS